MTPKAQQALADPKFYQLPPAEQQKALAMVDKDYAGLPLDERNKVLQMGRQKLSAVPSPVTSAPTKVTAPTEAPHPEGFWASAVAPFVGMAQGVKFALYEGPQNPSEAAILGEAPGENPAWASPILGRAVLAMKRMLVDPQVEQGKQAAAEFRQAAPTSLHPTPEQLSHRQLAGGHALAAVIPMLGPWAANVGKTEGEQIGTGNYKGAAGTAVGNLALALAPEAVKPVAVGVADMASDVKSLPLRVSKIVTGTGARSTGDLVRDVQDENAKSIKDAKTANETADQKHLRDTQDALHETEGLELQYQQALQQAADEAARKTAEARKQYIEQRRNINASNQQADAARKSASAQQSKLALRKAQLQAAWRALLSYTETARANALRIGNTKYNGVNDALSNVESDPKFLSNAVLEAAESLRGSKAEPPLLKSMEKATLGSNVTYGDLQGDYSTLGNEISKGGLPGDVYHAYDTLHEAIGQEMQRIADSKGQGAALKDAQNYWRRMKQTFGKPLTPTDVASKTVKTSAPDVASADEQANRIRNLGSFDPRIPQIFNHVQNIQKGIDALPDAASPRQIVQKFAEAYRPAASVTRPGVVEPGPVDPVARVAPPDRPKPVVPSTRTISPEDVIARKAANLQTSASRSANIGQRALDWRTVSAGGAALGMLAEFEGFKPMLLAGGTAVAAPLIMDAVSRFLERPGVAAKLTGITPADIARIPPELRSQAMRDLYPIIEGAEAKGIKVSPILAAYAAAIQNNRGNQSAQQGSQQ